MNEIPDQWLKTKKGKLSEIIYWKNLNNAVKWVRRLDFINKYENRLRRLFTIRFSLHISLNEINNINSQHEQVPVFRVALSVLRKRFLFLVNIKHVHSIENKSWDSLPDKLENFNYRKYLNYMFVGKTVSFPSRL